MKCRQQTLLTPFLFYEQISLLDYSLVDHIGSFGIGTDKVWQQSRGIKLYYETYGQGEPLLMIHGNGGSISAFSNQIPYFAQKYKVIAVDSRAQGKTIDNRDSLSFEMMADDFNALLDSMVNDKDISTVLSLLPKNATYYFTQAAIPRALDAQKLYDSAQKHNLNGKIFASVASAIEAAKGAANEDDFIYIGGSTFVVAEAI